jgi:hypothetical protein
MRKPVAPKRMALRRNWKKSDRLAASDEAHRFLLCLMEPGESQVATRAQIRA